MSEVRRSQSEGFHTVLLSGAYYNFLNNIGKKLGFDTVIGTKMHFINGLLDYNKELEIVSGELKLEKVRECFRDSCVDRQESRAYADSYSDLHILKSVGQPVAVNPDAKLKAIAAEMNWKVIA